MHIIAHLDMDAFFASVEEREKPWLSGSPVVVGADPDGGYGRGVVATANYRARAYGIHSALPISKAWQYSEAARKRGEPGAIFITPRAGKYGVISREVTDIVREFVPVIQKTSVDEMYLDLTFTGSYKRAEALVKRIKRAIKKRSKLTASIGIGPNKMVAKIASDFEKPDGLTVVSENDVLAFLAPLPVRSVPGVGPKMEARLRCLNIATIADLRMHSKKELTQMFGSWGTVLHNRSHGIAEAAVSQIRAPEKSIGEHHTFASDTESMKEVDSKLSEMAGAIVRRMKQKSFHGFRTTVLTVRFSDFETKQRSVTSKAPMCTTRELELKTMKLLLPFFERTENPRQKTVRMIGLRIEKLH